MRFFSKKEVLIVGKEEPDPDWEGIDGLRYTETSEFSKKYQPPAHLKDVLHKIQKKIETVKPKVDNKQVAPKKTIPQIVVQEENIKNTKSMMNNNVKHVTENSKHVSPKEENFDKIKQESQMILLKPPNEYISSDEDVDEDENNKDSNFQQEEESAQRSVRYSQSAQLSHALY